jgi:four helix bundle protein
MGHAGAKNYRELRIWEAARAVKQALHDLSDQDQFKREQRLYHQIREAAASAASQISEGYGRFEPLDHARYLKMGRASLIECQNHLVDAMDRGLIPEAIRAAIDEKIRGLLKGVDELIAYLQSDEAKKNVERIKRQRSARRNRRREP